MVCCCGFIVGLYRVEYYRLSIRTYSYLLIYLLFISRSYLIYSSLYAIVSMFEDILCYLLIRLYCRCLREKILNIGTRFGVIDFYPILIGVKYKRVF